MCDSFWTPNSELAVRSYFYLSLAGILFLAIVAFSLVLNERDANVFEYVTVQVVVYLLFAIVILPLLVVG